MIDLVSLNIKYIIWIGIRNKDRSRDVKEKIIRRSSGKIKIIRKEIIINIIKVWPIRVDIRERVVEVRSSLRIFVRKITSWVSYITNDIRRFRSFENLKIKIINGSLRYALIILLEKIKIITIQIIRVRRVKCY